jgi:hypothetical protein
MRLKKGAGISQGKSRQIPVIFQVQPEYISGKIQAYPRGDPPNFSRTTGGSGRGARQIPGTSQESRPKNEHIPGKSRVHPRSIPGKRRADLRYLATWWPPGPPIRPLRPQESGLPQVKPEQNPGKSPAIPGKTQVDSRQNPGTTQEYRLAGPSENGSGRSGGQANSRQPPGISPSQARVAPGTFQGHHPYPARLEPKRKVSPSTPWFRVAFSVSGVVFFVGRPQYLLERKGELRKFLFCIVEKPVITERKRTTERGKNDC